MALMASLIKRDSQAPVFAASCLRMPAARLWCSKEALEDTDTTIQNSEATKLRKLPGPSYFDIAAERRSRHPGNSPPS